jgi:acetylornithine deacetylase/succinyl-diaminopimelate desuccinylase-like protein
MSDWHTYLEGNRERFLEELFEFLSIPSISSLPEHASDVAAAARWVEARLKAAGIDAVEVLPTGGHPVVYGEWLNAGGAPTVLIYGHFDTQPVDPLDLWETSPFEPTVRDGRIYARGANDDKGNMFLPIAACEALLKTAGALPLNVKFFFEGQEEIGSPQLPGFVAEHRDRLACDLVLSADGGQWREDQPCLVMSTRGLAAVFVDVQGPGHDLHSGTYGGTVANPIHALARILDTLHDDEGRVAVEGFYDQVRPMNPEEREATARVPFDREAYLDGIGALDLFGEPGFTTWERAWCRPTLEVNGIYGGFQGAGVKTVLPSTAHAKLSCRLVADQDPEQVTRRVAEHIGRAAPPGVRVTARRGEKGAVPYRIPQDHPGLDVAGSVLEEVYGVVPLRVGMGGTIPVNGIFLRELNACTIIFAFGLPDERQHSPNEFFRLSGFDRGQRAYAMVLERLAGAVGLRSGS